MKPLEEARSEVLSSVGLLGVEQVPIWQARGRVLAADVVAPESVPPFANSAMDGFAVRAADVSAAGSVLEVIGDLPAGSSTDIEVRPGQAIKIMTGAPMPPGADTVVRVEDTSTEGSKVTISTAVEPGTSVRPAGGDVPEGQLVFTAGTRLTPMHVGVLATIGVGYPEVFRRPRVAFMSTGDELTPPEATGLEPGAIRDSNRPMLLSLLEDSGVEPVDFGIIPDDPDVLREAFTRAAEADVVVSTGGVSMGDYDVTKMVLQGDAHVDFWQVAIQPAKPFAFGRIGDALFFGLPGNPVSVLVSFEQFARPALLKMQGARRDAPAPTGGHSGGNPGYRSGEDGLRPRSRGRPRAGLAHRGEVGWPGLKRPVGCGDRRWIRPGAPWDGGRRGRRERDRRDVQVA